MKSLVIPRITVTENVFGFMDSLPAHHIDHNSWPAFETDCSARVVIAYGSNTLFVKYYVVESKLKVLSREINSAVNKDNCVELFLSFGNDANYYNLEFNCLGAGKIAYGENRDNRVLLDPGLVSQIDTDISLETIGNRCHWELMLSIPSRVFKFNNVNFSEGQEGKANFYKCGDDLPQPHFLSWNRIETERPDFHQPSFFGSVIFSSDPQSDPGYTTSFPVEMVKDLITRNRRKKIYFLSIFVYVTGGH